jgi:hypothetical protein
MNIPKRTLLSPVLVAIYWSACYNPLSNDSDHLSRMEKDIRSGIVAAALSCLLLLIISTFNYLDERKYFR